MSDRTRGAVLLLHGAGGGGWEWNPWARVLRAGGWQVAAPDLVPAAPGIEATTFDDYRRQAEAALAALPRPRAIVGASLGGLLAAACAAAADALVLVNPLPPSPWHGALAAGTFPPRVAWGARASLAGTRAALRDADAGDAWFAFRRWRDESGAVLAQAHAGIAIARPTCPVLVIAARDDEHVPSATSLAFAAAWEAEAWCEPGAHVSPLLGAGAAALAGRVVTWLNVKVVSRGS